MNTRMNTRRNCFPILLPFILCLALAGCFSVGQKEPVRYVTWDSLEPDAWASVWLIKRHLAPDAVVVVKPLGAPVSEGIPFGVPAAKYQRVDGVSVYESLLQGFHVTDPDLLLLGKIIHDIEISPWSNSRVKQTAVLEQAYRSLQDRFTLREVPVACYGMFFDLAYQLLKADKAPGEWGPLFALGEDGGECKGNNNGIATRDNRPFVRRVDVREVLDMIGAGKKVVFVDAREGAEFDELHIPGAINLKLREVTKATAPRFVGADLVIGYCIKDFRGFEMARALSEVGVKNAAIMKPYGLAGWRALKMPTTGVDGLNETQALGKLQDCARGISQCL